MAAAAAGEETKKPSPPPPTRSTKPPVTQIEEANQENKPQAQREVSKTNLACFLIRLLPPRSLSFKLQESEGERGGKKILLLLVRVGGIAAQAAAAAAVVYACLVVVATAASAAKRLTLRERERVGGEERRMG
jgi:hypothetical protein